MRYNSDMRKLVIFDFDGTLVDTITDVGICFNEALKVNDLPQHPLDAFGRFAGGNLETVVSRMLPQDQITVENIDRVKTVYRKLYLESKKPNTKPYPGMMHVLDTLKAKGYKIAVNSNKGQALLDDMIQKMFPPEYFDEVVGYLESRPSKPDPCGVDMICRACGMRREDAVYVGDGASDIATAEAAEIPCIYVTWGQGNQKDEENPYNYRVVNTADELLQTLQNQGK